jgi:hypothetical protein
MSAEVFQPTMLGGPFGRRIRARRGWVDELPWDEALPDQAQDAQWTWTQTTFSEYAAAASFAEISSALAAAGAPIDLIAVTSDFVVDEIVHVEASARIAGALGGGVGLEVDLSRLVRPPIASDPKLRAAELIVRTSCVGEALTVPLLNLSRELSGSILVSEALRRIMADEAAHAQLGGWFLDWADAWLDDDDRVHLGKVAGTALRAFSPLLGGGCSHSGFGAVACDRYDPVFARAAKERVARPLAERGIPVPAADLRAVGAIA